jgi:3-hydroxymyristoyl/3-hydroxydecanoyl-(acyl carrier protein) dehydratase
MAREVSIPAESIWFQGHFPGDPLLPGIAQLHLVLETLRGALGGVIRLTGLKRVRFKRVIRPGEPIAIAVEAVPDKPGHYRFALTVADETACSGMMTTESTPPADRD